MKVRYFDRNNLKQFLIFNFNLILIISFILIYFTYICITAHINLIENNAIKSKRLIIHLNQFDAMKKSDQEQVTGDNYVEKLTILVKLQCSPQLHNTFSI